MIYRGDTPLKPFKGDYTPVNIYKGDVKVAGWELSEKTGTELSWDDTYNDKVLSAVVEGKSEQVQTVQGKNLFDMSISPRYDSNKKCLVAPAYAVSLRKTLKQLCPNLKVGDMVTLSGISSGAQFIYLNVPASTQWNFGVTKTITQEMLDALVYIYNDLTKPTEPTDIWLQLELGSTATPYQPYCSYSAHRDIILRGLPDGTRDEWDAVTGTVIRNIGVKVFDGTEAWDKNTDITVTNAYNVFLVNYSQSKFAAMSTHFKNGKNYNNVGTIYAGVGCNLIPSLSGDDFCATTADFKAWLAAQHAAGTPVTVLYQLAEPTIEQIDPMALPTYPRYTRLECDTQTRAKVRVVETGC